MGPRARRRGQGLEQDRPLEHLVPDRFPLQRLDRLHVRRLGNADLPVVDLEAELGQQRRLDVPHQLLGRETGLGQHVDLAHLAQRRGDHPRREDPLQAGEQVLRPPHSPGIRDRHRRPAAARLWWAGRSGV